MAPAKPSHFSAIFPPKPEFTDANLHSLDGKVYIITGAASGIGLELAKMLYAAGGTVYIAARSTSRCGGAIENIKTQAKVMKGGKGGRLESMVVDLADLATVKGAVDSFLGKETRLDILFHNAAVMVPPVGSKDKLGHDLEMGTNCLAPYLMTLLLEPIILRTSASSPAFSIRIVWVASLMQLGTPAGAMSFDPDGTPNVREKQMDNYMQSKVGVTWLSAEFAKRLGSKGVLSVSVHPGLIRTELQRNMPALPRTIMGIVFKPPIYGAYSELYAGFSSELKDEHNGGYVVAWGRIAGLEEDIKKGLRSKSDGGSGAAKVFVQYCDRETKKVL